MRFSNMDMKTTVDKDQLLAKLKENREKHKAMYQEAKEGYIARAEEELRRTIADLRSGKATSLHFTIRPPEDNTKVYDTVIQMLTWSTDRTIVLSSGEFRNLVEDEWDWTDQWLMSNRMYADSVRVQATAKGLL